MEINRKGKIENKVQWAEKLELKHKTRCRIWKKMSTTVASNISSDGWNWKKHNIFLTGLKSIIKERDPLFLFVSVWMTSPDWSFRQDLTRGGSAVLSEDHILSGEHTGPAENVCKCVCLCVGGWVGACVHLYLWDAPFNTINYANRSLKLSLFTQF